jgi:hypothetical protein
MQSNGLDYRALSRFDYQILSSDFLADYQRRQAEIGRIALNKGLVTLCTGGCVRSRLFAASLLDVGAEVLTPRGYSYSQFTSQLEKGRERIEAGGFITHPTVGGEKVGMIVCHAELGSVYDTESGTLNTLLQCMAGIQIPALPRLTIIDGDEVRYQRYLDTSHRGVRGYKVD